LIDVDAGAAHRSGLISGLFSIQPAVSRNVHSSEYKWPSLSPTLAVGMAPYQHGR
jgi:hypothetical protein